MIDLIESGRKIQMPRQEKMMDLCVKRKWTHGLLCALVSTFIGCDQPNPREPAEPIGQFPVWGQNFSENNQPSSDSMLLGAAEAKEGPAPKVQTDEPQAKGGSAVPAANPMAGENWSGGQADAGKIVFLNQCALCHGPDGKGGEKPGIGLVPTLRDPAWQSRMTDGKIAKTITHGRGVMPSFMGKLSKDELLNVVAYIRSIKKQAGKPSSEQPPKSDSPQESEKASNGQASPAKPAQATSTTY